MRGVSCKLTRELGTFKLLAAFADPLLTEESKSEVVRNIEAGVSPLYGSGDRSSKGEEDSKEEDLEDYFTRIIKAHRS